MRLQRMTLCTCNYTMLSGLPDYATDCASTPAPCVSVHVCEYYVSTHYTAFCKSDALTMFVVSGIVSMQIAEWH